MRKDVPSVECPVCIEIKDIFRQIHIAEYWYNRVSGHIGRHIDAIIGPKIARPNQIITSLGDKVDIINSATSLYKRLGAKPPKMVKIDDCKHCFREAEAKREIDYWKSFLTNEKMKHYEQHREYDMVIGEYKSDKK